MVLSEQFVSELQAAALELRELYRFLMARTFQLRDAREDAAMVQWQEAADKLLQIENTLLTIADPQYANQLALRQQSILAAREAAGVLFTELVSPTRNEPFDALQLVVGEYYRFKPDGVVWRYLGSDPETKCYQFERMPSLTLPELQVFPVLREMPLAWVQMLEKFYR